MVEGWNRVCPNCGNSYGDKVTRIAFHPTFRCKCCYVWDGSNANSLGVFDVPGDATDEELDALAAAIFEGMKSRTEKAS